MQDVFDDHIIDGAHAQHAGGARDRIERLHGARECTRMGKSGGAALGGSTELHHHDRLAGLARHAAGRHEGRRVLYRFQIRDDHGDIVVHGVVGDVVGARQPGLVARGDDRAGVEPAFLERALDRHGKAAGFGR